MANRAPYRSELSGHFQSYHPPGAKRGEQNRALRIGFAQLGDVHRGDVLDALIAVSAVQSGKFENMQLLTLRQRPKELWLREGKALPAVHDEDGRADARGG